MECNVYANQLAEFSWEIRDKSLEMIEKLPEAFMNWRLNNNTMSFAHIAEHLIKVDELFLEMLESDEKTYKWRPGSKDPHYKVEAAKFEELKQRLKELQKKRHAAIQSMDEETLDQKITGKLGEQSSVWSFIMQRLLEHEIYHRGQLSAYLKILQGEGESS